MQNILAGHTNSYHTYSLDEALEGISKAGFKYVELSAVRGWTEHVPLEAAPADIAADQGQAGAVGSDRLRAERALRPDHRGRTGRRQKGRGSMPDNSASP